jgi:hypothetical protein
MPFFKSRAVAEQLGCSYWKLYELLRSGQLAPPQKDTSGDYTWLDADVERARAALAARRARRKEAAGGPK